MPQKLTTPPKGSPENELEVIGRVLLVDIRKMCFQLWKDDGTSVQVQFTKDQEVDVISALMDHASARLRVRGCGEHGSDGVLGKVSSIESLELVPDIATSFDPSDPEMQAIIEKNFREALDDK